MQLQRHILQTQVTSLMLTMPQVASQATPPRSQSYMNAVPIAAGAASSAAPSLTHNGPPVWGSSVSPAGQAQPNMLRPLAGQAQPNMLRLNSSPQGLQYHQQQQQQPPRFDANCSEMFSTAVSTNGSSGDRSNSLQPNVAVPPAGNNHGGTQGIIAVLAAAAVQAAATHTSTDSTSQNSETRSPNVTCGSGHGVVATGRRAGDAHPIRRRSFMTSSSSSTSSGDRRVGQDKKPRARKQPPS